MSCRRGLVVVALILCISPAIRADEPRPADARPKEGEGVIRRFALVVGANDGGAARVRLKYAETDALAFTRVLQKLGGLADPDRVLLMNPGRAEIANGFERMRTLLRSARDGTRRTELFVYYSGHSDDEGLLVAEDRFGYGELRDELESMPADVRIAILDSCASGAMTRRKGGTFVTPFLVDDSSNVQGHAILTSAAENEAAQESDRLQSSFFTHFLLSGLRGAADVTNDGRVTLNEAYQFAFNETLARTARTSAGAQHAGYDIQLSGSGDLVMTDLRRASGGIAIAPDLDGRLYVRDGNGRLAAELRKFAGRPVDLGLEPGPYAVTLVSEGEAYGARLVVYDGRRTSLGRSEFSALPVELARARGDSAEPAGPSAVPARPGITATDTRIVIDLPKVEWPSGQVFPKFDWSAVPPAPVPVPLPPKETVRPEPPPSAPVPPADKADTADTADTAPVKAPVPETPAVVTAPPPSDPPMLHEPITLRVLGDYGAHADRVVTNLSLGLFLGRVGRVEGLQLATLMNETAGDLRGLQLAGLVNGAGRDALGLQIGGLVNIAGRDVGGVQLSSLVNVAGRDAEGTRAAAVGNATGRHVRGLHVAGLFNVDGGGIRTGGPHADDVWAALLAGGFNVSGGAVRGLQLSGGFNWAVGPVSGLQAASLLNRSAGHYGAQIGLLNVSGHVEGVQVGLVNIAGRVKGTQVGLLNFNEELSGIPLGLFTFSKKGERHLDLWASDFAAVNAGFRTGTKHVYTLLAVHLDPRLGGRSGLSLGVGAQATFDALRVAIDLSVGGSHSDDRLAAGGTFMSQLRVLVGYRVAEAFGLFGGVGVNQTLSSDDRLLPIQWGTVEQVELGRLPMTRWPAVFGGVEF